MILITGACGFIGFHLALRLFDLGFELALVDDMSNEAARETEARRAFLEECGMRVLQLDVRSRQSLRFALPDEEYTHVIHLAAMPGVRKGPEQYREYIEQNVLGAQNVFEYARTRCIPHVLYASSSSVYAGEASAEREDNSPRSVYAATKVACEHIAAVYGRIHGMKMTGLRFFTVYGDHGRPDMAYYKFLTRMRRNEPITIHRGMMRDMTHVDDVTRAVHALMFNRNGEGHEVVNIGTGDWHSVEEMVQMLEAASGIKALVKVEDAHPADMRWSLADNRRMRECGWEPKVKLRQGLEHFVKWHVENVKI